MRLRVLFGVAAIGALLWTVLILLVILMFRLAS